jgi:hypothetical protein
MRQAILSGKACAVYADNVGATPTATRIGDPQNRLIRILSAKTNE